MPDNTHDGTAPPPLIADHPALEMLNTVSIVEGQPRDHWQTDEDVRAWLARMELPLPRDATAASGQLLDTARRLREAIRYLVQQRKASALGDPGVLNDFLRDGASYVQLVWPSGASPQVVRHGLHHSLAAALYPLASQAAELLSQGDFERVRACEHPECVLWFYDRTKSHRRRWCSMAVCGNRFKVTEHRKRVALK
ncbi:ABATE domain-containing protein [Pseudomonas sp. RIT-PI-S]|uniref:CGNR zinc finger domain-containing protein n=1 Tax=Pseudomonas sp. RIT-PI-S TaxID=3035295 RepID=UPI0021D9626D|nr:ABATE domain-containing protein [Pseudomonas sp. RIT-PI-S]